MSEQIIGFVHQTRAVGQTVRLNLLTVVCPYSIYSWPSCMVYFQQLPCEILHRFELSVTSISAVHRNIYLRA